jgi:hypothetical protein
MPATPATIAKLTNDGLVVTAELPAVKALFPIDARNLGENEIETFFDSGADAQAMIDEKLSILGQVPRPHEGIEIDTQIGIGSSIPISPSIPRFTLIDEPRGLLAIARVRAIADDMETDRFSIEMLG